MIPTSTVSWTLRPQGEMDLNFYSITALVLVVRSPAWTNEAVFQRLGGTKMTTSPDADDAESRVGGRA